MFIDEVYNPFIIVGILTGIGFAFATQHYHRLYKIALGRLVTKEEDLEALRKKNRALDKELKALKKASKKDAPSE